MRSRCLVLLLALIIPFSGLTGGTLTITKDGGGDGFVRVNGVDQTLPFSQSYAWGTSLTLEAVPATTGSQFDWWSGSALVNGTDNPVTFTMPLFGNVSVTANFSLSPPDINSDFTTWQCPHADVGGPSSYRSYSISNAGGQTLVVVSMSFTGTNASEFFITSGGGAFNLAAGASHSITVGFTPAGSGLRRATLNIFSNDPDENPYQIELIAEASTPDIASYPASWDFGPVSIGGHSDKTFTVRNDGDGGILVTSVMLTGSNASEFTIIQCGRIPNEVLQLHPLDVTVRFAPTGTGAKSASLTFDSNDPDENPFHVGLSGTGTAAPAGTPDIASDPASWDYGAVNAGSYLDKTFVISNAGAAGLNVTAVTLSGADASEFHIQSGGGSFTLAPAATRAVVVRFTPAGSGNKSASLYFTSNDPDENPFLVHLSSGGGTSIVVDGNKDSFYSTLSGPDDGYVHIPSFMHNDNGAPDNEKDLSADLWMAWDPTYLYIYEEVVDNVEHLNNPTTWQNDVLEIYFDPDPSLKKITGPPGFGLSALDSADVEDPANMAGVNDMNIFKSLGATKADYSRRKTTDGYALECRVKWDWIKATGWGPPVPAVGNSFGMAVMNHDNDVSQREGSISWAAVLKDAVWNDTQLHGTITFEADHKLKMEAKNSILPANVNADAWAYVPGADLFRIAIDGEKDPWYNELTGPDEGYIHIPSFMHNDNGAPDNDKDLSANLWVAWDADYLYVYEEVKDNVVHLNNPTTYQNDCLEMYFDPDPSLKKITGPTGFGLSALDSGDVEDPANLSGVADMKAFASFAAVTKADYGRRLTADGYALECRVKWDWIQMTGWGPPVPAVGNSFGMAVMNHDNDVSQREGSISWAAVLRDAVWNDTQLHGTVTFEADHKLKLEAKNAIVPTNVNADAWAYVPRALRIVVDGQKDPFYETLTGPDDGYLQIRYFANSNIGLPKGGDADLSAKVWSAWDKDWYYIYAEVRDDSVSAAKVSNDWETDAMELKIDGQATDSTQTSVSNGTIITALDSTEVAAGLITNSLNAIAEGDKQYARRKFDGGYVLEYALKLSILGGTEPIDAGVGKVFGMAYHFMDNDGKGRDACIQWSAYLNDLIWNTPKYHATVKFLADNKLQFIPSNHMTGLTNPVPYDGSDYPDRMAVEDKAGIVKEFDLSQNYPNPFNPTTTISYSIPSVLTVRLTVYDIMGRQVAVLVDEKQAPGVYKVNFDGRRMASGIYFYKLEAGSYVFKQKMVMLK